MPVYAVKWGVLNDEKVFRSAMPLVSAGLLSRLPDVGRWVWARCCRQPGLQALMATGSDTDGVTRFKLCRRHIHFRATDTGQVLAQGSYTYRDQQNIDICLPLADPQHHGQRRLHCRHAKPDELHILFRRTIHAGAPRTTPGNARCASMTAPTPMVEPDPRLRLNAPAHRKGPLSRAFFVLI